MSDMAMFRIGSDNVVTFTMSGISRTLTGPEEALQLVAAALYQDVGSNVFSPQDGGSALADLVGRQPVLVQISAAKRLRDQAERVARDLDLPEVTEAHVRSAGRSLGLGEPA